MSFNVIPISSCNFIPLSASYKYDNKLKMFGNLSQHDDGYTFFEQPLFNNIKDIKFAKDSFFGLTSSILLENIMSDIKYVDTTDLVVYTAILAQNGKYVSNVDNVLYASSTEIGTNEFFRIRKTDEGYYTISQNNLYATIENNDNSFNIIMQEQLEEDSNNLQKFVFYFNQSDNLCTINTNFNIPSWPINGNNIKRFLSYNTDEQVKAIGMIKNANYTPEHKYKFSITTGSNTLALGYDGNVIWVKYYNDLLYKFFNKDVTIKDTINNLTQNYIVEYPYKTEINIQNGDVVTGEFKVNLINMKNIMTPEYNYTTKKE